jgi:hypothetical protein
MGTPQQRSSKRRCGPMASPVMPTKPSFPGPRARDPFVDERRWGRVYAATRVR